MKTQKAKQLKGEIEVPGDKSISHRAIMIGSLAKGETIIHNFLLGADCLATVDCLKKLGVEIEVGKTIVVKGKGAESFKEPSETLDVGNSGTTIRILSGILAGQPFTTTITGDASIQKRPMRRIVDPLTQMGAKIEGQAKGGQIFPALTITGAELKPITYKTSIASAQVKSAILLAGLFAKGSTAVIEPAYSRDHTERMLKYFGAPVRLEQKKTCVEGGSKLLAQEVYVPGDISSAAYFMVAASLVPGSEIIIKNVGINPSRDGILEVLRRMGADIEVFDEQILSGEPRAKVRIRTARKLRAIEIKGEIIPRLIDEIPIIAVLATQAEGQTIIKNARELKVKESDRIATMTEELSKLGAKIEPTQDGMIIEGPTKLQGAVVNGHGDHRVAMSLAIAGLIANGETMINDTECIKTSFPGFETILDNLRMQ